MMTIKVCRNDETGFVHLHEGKNPRYVCVQFNDLDSYNRQIKKLTEDYSLLWYYDMIDFKEEYEKLLELKEQFPKDNSKNEVFNMLAIYFTNSDDNIVVCLTRSAKVFIMHDGKTVDTIYC